MAYKFQLGSAKLGGSVESTGQIKGTSLDASDGDITNVQEIKADTIDSDGTQLQVQGNNVNQILLDGSEVLLQTKAKMNAATELEFRSSDQQIFSPGVDQLQFNASGSEHMKMDGAEVLFKKKIHVSGAVAMEVRDVVIESPNAAQLSMNAPAAAGRFDMKVNGSTKFTVTGSGIATLGTLELGHASDTTIARAGAGDINVEGNIVYRAGGTDVPLTDGGTGASSAGDARTNLGVAIGSDVQAYDVGLENLAGVSMAANKMYFTSADNVHASTDLTVFARSILDDTDATAVRSTLGSVIGTNVLAHDAEIQKLAGMLAADELAVITATEMEFLDGATTANDLASKVVVLDAQGDLVLPGELRVSGDLVYVNTTNLKVSDALVTFASGTSAFGAGRGFEIGEGSDGEGNFKTAGATGDLPNHFKSSLALSSSAYFGDGSNLSGVAASNAQSLRLAQEVCAADITASADVVMVDSSAARIIEMPDITTDTIGRMYIIKDITGNAGSFAITIRDSATGHNLDGEASISIESEFGAVNLMACSASAGGFFYSIF